MATGSATITAAEVSWEALHRSMPLGDYVEMILKDKGLNKGAHDYVYSAVNWAKASGMYGDEDDPRGPFGDLQTQADVVDRTLDYLKLAAWGDPMERRALLFSGPPASGAEAIWMRLSEIVEAYSRSEAGHIYAIGGCPIAEDPLNLIEPTYRSEMLEVGSLQWVEGRLCPACRERFEGNVGSREMADISVRRVVLGRDAGTGVSLVSGVLGSADVCMAAERANRGLAIFENLTDSPREVVESVLELAAQRSFPGRLGQTRWDGVVLASVDRGTFEDMCAEPTFTRARLRTHVVPTPYGLSTDLETATYERHRAGLDILARVNFSPLVLPSTANLAVLTRSNSPDAPAGMRGLGPGRALAALESCALESGVTCVSPLHVLSELAQYVEVSPEQVEKAVRAYVQEAVEVLQKAATDGFEEQAADLLTSYRERLLWQLRESEGSGPTVGEGEPELRAMEDALGVKDQARAEFRAELEVYFERNPGCAYTDEPRMKAAIESRLLHSLRAILKALREAPEGSDGRDDWARQRGAVHDRLVNTYGFCDVCAVDLVEMLLATERPVRVKKGELLWEWEVRLDAKNTREQLQKFRAAVAAPVAQEAGVGS